MNSIALVPALAFLALAQVPTPPTGGPTLAELRTRLDAYERRTAEAGRAEPAELESIAIAVMEQARRSTTFAVWTGACGSTAVPASDDCGRRLWAVVKNTGESMTRRATAASALMATGDTTAATTLAGLLKTAAMSTVAQLVPIIEKMPAKEAVPLLTRLAGSAAPDDQELACEALSGFDVPDSHAAITKIVDANPPGAPPWLVCMIARTRLNEITTPGAVAGYGNTLQGRGQLFAARVMLEQSNDAGTQLLVDLTHRGSSSERLAVADLLVAAKPDAAIPVIDANVENPDPVIRAAALRSERGLKRSPSKTVRSMLVDADGIVRTRAAEVVIDWVRRSQNR